MNAIGARSWEAADKKKMEGELITPKRRQKNKVKKLMERARQTEDILSPELQRRRKRQKEETARKEIEARGVQCSLIARLARRPLKQGQSFEKLATVKEVKKHEA